MRAGLRSGRSLQLVLAAGFALLLVPFVTSTCGLLPASYAARAQEVTGVSICGGCSCYDGAERSQCEANERAAYERANPPRGRMEGVCTAGYFRSLRDPATGTYTREYHSPVYSRFRYTETRVDGFNEVDEAWKQFANANYTANRPAGDGWNFGPWCAVLSGGSARNARDSENWARMQAEARHQRVFMPVFGIADTPEERALEARLAKERAARLAEEKRLADAKAAEAARIKAAAEAKRRAEVSAMEAQLGAGKRASAERLLAMNEQVAKFRPKVPLAIMPKPGASPSATPSPARQCTRRQGTQPITNSAPTREAAVAGIARARGTPGGSETIVQSSVSAPVCSQQNALQLKPPPVGKCLSCISEQMAANMFGWVKGKGYPPPKTEWTCRATVSFTAERCGTGPSKVTAQ